MSDRTQMHRTESQREDEIEWLTKRLDEKTDEILRLRRELRMLRLQITAVLHE